MKKQNQTKTETTTTTTAPAMAPQVEQRPENRGPDFYQRLVIERPQEAASILATLCRRKDKALRAMNDAHSAGKEFGDCYRIALSIAFPKSKAAA